MAKKIVLPIGMILTGLLIFTMQVFSQEKDNETTFAERAELKEETIVITINGKIVNRIPLVKIDEIVPPDKAAKEKIANMVGEDIQRDVEKVKIHKKTETAVYFSKDKKYFAIEEDTYEAWNRDGEDLEHEGTAGLYRYKRDIKYMSANGRTLWENKNTNFGMNEVSATGKYILCSGGDIEGGEKGTDYLLDRNGKEVLRFGAPIYNCPYVYSPGAISDDEKYLIVRAFDGKGGDFWGLIDMEKKTVRKISSKLNIYVSCDSKNKRIMLSLEKEAAKYITYLELDDTKGITRYKQFEIGPQESITYSNDVKP